MYFSDGFVYAPPPSVPFLPVSSPRLVMFVANETGENDNHSEGGQLPGEIGAGVRRSSSAFWFDAYSAYLGCDNPSAYQCELQITGLVYHEKTKSEVAAFHQTVSLLPCLLPDNCEAFVFKLLLTMSLSLGSWITWLSVGPTTLALLAC
jgi:hypothetical protein